MRELSLHLLDLAENAAASGAAHVEIRLAVDSVRRRLVLCVADDGRGMTPEETRRAPDPFYTTRAVRGVGLGLSLCKAAAERTGGAFALQSAPERGTCVTAAFCLDHIDCAPLGALAETLAALVFCHPQIAFTVSAEADGVQRRADAAAICAAVEGLAPGDARAMGKLKIYFTDILDPFLQKGEGCMKSLEELAAIRDKMKQTVETRMAAHDTTRIAVGMATCGIAAGARGVLNAFTEEVAKSGLHGVLVTQTGCIGLCQYEPVVEVLRAGEEKVTYVKMTPEKAARVVAEHLVGGTPVAEYTIENAQ